MLTKPIGRGGGKDWVKGKDCCSEGGDGLGENSRNDSSILLVCILRTIINKFKEYEVLLKRF